MSVTFTYVQTKWTSVFVHMYVDGWFFKSVHKCVQYYEYNANGSLVNTIQHWKFSKYDTYINNYIGPPQIRTYASKFF